MVNQFRHAHEKDEFKVIGNKKYSCYTPLPFTLCFPHTVQLFRGVFILISLYISCVL
jgi:hypothetical protein